MPYKNKEDADKYYQEYYLKKFGHYPKPLVRKTKEEKLATRRAWYHKNVEKVKLDAKKSYKKHKEQRKLDSKLWVEKNKEHVTKYHKEYNKKYYQENKEETDKRNIQWAKDNPEKSKAITDRFKEARPEEIKGYFLKYNKTLKGRFNVLKGSAVSRNYKVQISLEEFSKIVVNPCVYCGENEKRIGVDRIDNKKGYTVDNSAPCCTICNMMKKAMTVKEFIDHTKKISNHKFIS